MTKVRFTWTEAQYFPSVGQPAFTPGEEREVPLDTALTLLRSPFIEEVKPPKKEKNEESTSKKKSTS